jgi:hypothetical protein
VEATAPDGSTLNNLDAAAVVVAPGGLVTRTVSLRQTGAGEYEGTFEAAAEGAYLVQIQASGAGLGSADRVLGVVVPYSPEYQGGESDRSLLRRIAGLTGGRELSLEGLSAAFDHNLPPATREVALWPWLLLLAALLLPLDVGVRRLGVTREDLARAWSELRERGGGRSKQPVPAGAGPASQMASLMDAKARTRERLDRPTDNTQSSASGTPRAEVTNQPLAGSQQPPPSSARELQASEVATGTPAATPTPPFASGGIQAPGSDEGSLAARLRQARGSVKRET